MLHAYAAKFDVMRNFKKFLVFRVKKNLLRGAPQTSRRGRATGIGVHECLKKRNYYTAKKTTKPTPEGAAPRLLTPRAFPSSPFIRALTLASSSLPPPGPVSAARQPWKRTTAWCAPRRWSGWRTDRAGTARCAPPASPASVS